MAQRFSTGLARPEVRKVAVENHAYDSNRNAAVGQASTHSLASGSEGLFERLVEGNAPTCTLKPRPINVRPKASVDAKVICVHNPQSIHLPGS